MKVSKALKENIAAATRKLEKADGPVFLDRPFQGSYVLAKEPPQMKNVAELTFQDVGIEKAGSFWLVIEIM